MFLPEKEVDMLKRFIAYYKPHKKIFFLDMLASLLVSLIGMCYPIITRLVFKDYVPNENVQMIIICGGGLLVIYLLRMLLKFFIQYQGHVMGVKIQSQMRRDMFNHLEALPYSYFDEHETGRIMSRMTSDLQDVSELAHHGPENFFICGFMIIGSFIYLCTINWMMALIVFSCVPVLALISIVLRKKMRKAFLETRKNVAFINASVESSISGIRVTKAFTNSKKEAEKFEVSNQAYVKSRSQAYKAMGLFQSSTGFAVDLFYVVCIIAGSFFVLNGMIDLGDYLTFVVSISLFISPLQTLINFVEQFQDGTTGFRRFLEIIDEKPEQEKLDALQIFKAKGDIEFKNVSFKYESSDTVLNNVSFKINQGETIALVGESGGGKTTICHLIPNFYRATSGDIYLDGTSINDISLNALRKNIGIVQQDVFLFNGTIRENILYGKLDASEEELIDASKKANIYDYIMSLPNGFDSEIGERGVKLSGGQKQRLSIARVFLKNPSILILDEATSALDNTTEIMIQEALNELAKGRTTLIVAHRLSTIKNADRILVVNSGQIVESGSHKELLEKNGIYARLYNLQFRSDYIA